MKMTRLFHSMFYSLLIISLFTLTGCLTTSPKLQDKEAIFYPPKPELPRLQFLTSLSGAKDIEKEKSAFETFVTGKKKKELRLDKPYGVAIHDGKIYVCDTNATVMVFDFKAGKFQKLAGAKGLGSLVQPININITRDGVKYVADPVRGQVVAYDDKDFYVKAFGRSGGWKPVAAVAYGDFLYVADIKNHAVKVFDIKSGNLVKAIGQEGGPEEVLGLPVNLSFDDNGILHVVDVGRFQVMKYDRDGHFLGKIGAAGQNYGYFARPRGLAIDRDDRIFVVDAAFNNVQLFKENGQILMFFGQGGREAGDFYLPAGITIDYDNIDYFREFIDPNFEVEFLVIVTNQFEKHSVNVFGYGKEKNVAYPTDDELLEKARKLEKEWLAKNKPKNNPEKKGRDLE